MGRTRPIVVLSSCLVLFFVLCALSYVSAEGDAREDLSPPRFIQLQTFTQFQRRRTFASEGSESGKKDDKTKKRGINVPTESSESSEKSDKKDKVDSGKPDTPYYWWDEWVAKLQDSSSPAS